MITETLIKKTRTPRNSDAIAAGLFKLPLEEKVSILKALNDNINAQVKAMQDAANAAQELLKS